MKIPFLPSNRYPLSLRKSFFLLAFPQASYGRIFRLLVAIVMSLSCGAGEPALAQTAPQRTRSVTAEEAQLEAVPLSPSLLNDTARILAGLRPHPGSPLEAVAQSPAFLDHARDMADAWDKLERTHLSRMRVWASGNLPGRSSSQPAYYPFSGPDILHLYTFYPGASSYVLCGLEPVGSVPDLASLPLDQTVAGLAQLRGSLNSLLRYTYFMTKEMHSDFTGNRFSGVVPVLLLMLARCNCELRELNYVQLGSDGSVHIASKGRSNGVRILFKSKSSFSSMQEIIFFSYNLSDGGATSYINLMRQRGLGHTYLKAASYLMHGGGFDRIRNGILACSQTVLQDDSGIPLRYFRPESWRLQFFGDYQKPIETFLKYYQDDLRSVYTSAPGMIKPLTFGIGYYFWGNQSNLLLALRSGAAPSDSAGAVPEAPIARPSSEEGEQGQAPPRRVRKYRKYHNPDVE